MDSSSIYTHTFAITKDSVNVVELYCAVLGYVMDLISCAGDNLTEAVLFRICEDGC